jgi:hypothetical protein
MSHVEPLRWVVKTTKWVRAARTLRPYARSKRRSRGHRSSARRPARCGNPVWQLCGKCKEFAKPVTTLGRG